MYDTYVALFTLYYTHMLYYIQYCDIHILCYIVQIIMVEYMHSSGPCCGNQDKQPEDSLHRSG